MKAIFHFKQEPCNLGNDSEQQRRRNGAVYLETENIFACPKYMGINP